MKIRMTILVLLSVVSTSASASLSPKTLSCTQSNNGTSERVDIGLIPIADANSKYSYVGSEVISNRKFTFEYDEYFGLSLSTRIGDLKVSSEGAISESHEVTLQVGEGEGVVKVSCSYLINN